MHVEFIGESVKCHIFGPSEPLPVYIVLYIQGGPSLNLRMCQHQACVNAHKYLLLPKSLFLESSTLKLLSG